MTETCVAFFGAPGLCNVACQSSSFQCQWKSSSEIWLSFRWEIQSLPQLQIRCCLAMKKTAFAWIAPSYSGTNCRHLFRRSDHAASADELSPLSFACSGSHCLGRRYSRESVAEQVLVSTSALRRSYGLQGSQGDQNKCCQASFLNKQEKFNKKEFQLRDHDLMSYKQTIADYCLVRKQEKKEKKQSIS